MMDKLVRDLVPEQLGAKGVTARVSRYDDPAFLEALRAKLVEESVEYYAAADDEAAVAELADLMEVVLALAEMHGADAAALDEARRAKLAARGATRALPHPWPPVAPEPGRAPACPSSARSTQAAHITPLTTRGAACPR